MTWVSVAGESIVRAAKAVKSWWYNDVPLPVREAVKQVLTDLGQIVLKEGVIFAQQVVNQNRPFEEAGNELWSNLKHDTRGLPAQEAQALVFNVFRMQVSTLQIQKSTTAV